MTCQLPKIIDVHAHIIPGADDGARTMEETIGMLRSAYKQGIRGIIATPHYIHRHSRMNSCQILELLTDVQEAAKEISPDFKIYSGQELLYYEGLLEKLESKRVLTIENTRYILLEFPPSSSYHELFQAVRKVTFERYIPVLAHIERYPCLRKNGCLDELRHTGAYMQMNFTSLSGYMHPFDRHWCRKMITEQKIHFLGTDMHQLDYRPPDISQTIKWLQKTAAPDYLNRLFEKHPKQLLSGELIEP